MSALHGLLSRIKDAGAAFRDRGTFQTPDAFTGLLSPEEQASARSRGLLAMGAGILNGQGNALQAISQGVLGGQSAYDNAIGQTLQQHDYLQQKSDEQIAREQQQKILRARVQIAQQFPVPENATESQRAAILQQMMIAYAKAGDTEMAGKIGEVVKSLGRDPNQNSKNQWEDFGGYKSLMAPDGTELRRITKTPSPKDPNSSSKSDDHYANTQTDKILDDFYRDTQDFQKANAGYEVLKGALAHPGLAQPFAVLDAYARVVNPGAVVRQGTMQVLEQMGSYDQKFRRWIDMAKEGKWPPDMLEGVKNTIDSIMEEHRKTYMKTRARYQERARRAGVNLDALLDVPEGSNDNVVVPKTATTKAPQKKYRQDNPFAGK